MKDAPPPVAEHEDEEVLRRLVEQRPAPSGEVADAVSEIEAARAELAASLEALTGAAQAAVDIPAKVRRNPVRTAALVAGSGFLLVGGPRRVARSVARRVLPRRRDRYVGLLPAEIEQVLKDTGVADDPEVRRALDEDFADYLRQKGRYGPEPNAARSFWRTFDRIAGPLGTAAARLMVDRLMAADQARTQTRAEARVRAHPHQSSTQPDRPD